MIKKILICAVFIFVKQASAAPINEVPPGQWRADFWRFSFLTDYFTTNANLSSSGIKTFNSLPAGNKLQVYELRPKLRYNLTNRASFYVGGGVVDVSATTASIGRTNSNVTETFAGMDYILAGQYSRLVGEIEGSYSTSRYSITDTNALLSDGADFVRAQLYFFRPTSFGNPFFHFGVQYRDQGYSQLGLYGVGYEKPIGQSFLIGLGAEGEFSFISDQNTQLYRTNLTDATMGGSHYFGAYNPSFTEGRLWAGYKPEPGWQMKLGYAQTFLGTNAAYGQSVFLTFSINFDPRADAEGFARFRQSKSSARKKGQKDINDFEPEPQNINPDLFKDEQRFEPLE